MNTNSIKSNLIYNLCLNAINILFPLITSPYIARVLGPEVLGKYNFSVSLSAWFLIFATFGTTTYGIREIAKVRNDKDLISKKFTEIFIINLIATIISFLLYLLVIVTNPKTNADMGLFIVSSFSILLNLFCIDWLYMGLENFKVITYRSLGLKLLSLFGIFIFVKQQDDYVVYALISVLAFGLTNIYNFMYSKNYVTLTFKNIEVRSHLRRISVFFFSNVVVSMYTIFDQVLLGLFSTNQDVAYYTASRQIYSVALCITLSVSTVLLPKLAYLYKHEQANYLSLLRKSIDYIYIFSVPSTMGLAILAKDIMWVFGGQEFEDAYIALVLLSTLVFTVALGTWQYNQIFVPIGKEKVGLRGQVLMALISISANLLLVPRWGYMGASLSLITAEIVGTVYGVYYSKNKIKNVKIDYITKSLGQYIFASIVMALFIATFKLLNLGPVINVSIGVIIGSLVYFGVLSKLKNVVCREFINYVQNLAQRTFNKGR